MVSLECGGGEKPSGSDLFMSIVDAVNEHQLDATEVGLTITLLIRLVSDMEGVHPIFMAQGYADMFRGITEEGGENAKKLDL